MRYRNLARLALAGALALMTACAPTTTTTTTTGGPPVAHLEKRGAATQLIVDGKPFLALAGELTNTAASSPEHMKTVWPNLVTIGLNTVLAPMAWAWIEPQEGKFDFTFADNIIQDARANHMRIAWLWFGSWKNGLTNFAPTWVVANQDRFPRAQLAGGKTVEVLSTLSEANRTADAKAFAAFMRHIKEGDSPARTTIMVQLENEVGLIGDSRDRSALGNEAFAKPVPKELIDYLTSHKEKLLPETMKVWGAAGSKTSGTWEQVFGAGKGKADEVFMAWNYSSYIGKVAEAGKAEYPVPMYVNTWIVQPEDKGPGDYPSGGPQDHMHDIWRAGGPQIDMLSPDVYLPNFNELADRYSRIGGPLFIPESSATVGGAANLFYAIGQHNGIGYSPWHRSAGAVARIPAGIGNECGGADGSREPPVLQGLQSAGAAQPDDSGSSGKGHHWSGLAQQERPADERPRFGRLHGERKSDAQPAGSQRHPRGRLRDCHGHGAG